MRNDTPWRSDDPSEQFRIDVEQFSALYRALDISSSVSQAMESLRLLAEMGFDGSIVNRLMTDVECNFFDLQHYIDLVYSMGHPKINLKPGGGIRDHQRGDILAACAYMSITFYFLKADPKLAWPPLMKATFHMGVGEGLAHPIFNKSERAELGGQKKSANAKARSGAVAENIFKLFNEMKPKTGWTSLSIATEKIASSLLLAVLEEKLDLHTDRNDMIHQVNELIRRDKALRQDLETTLSPRAKTQIIKRRAK